METTDTHLNKYNEKQDDHYVSFLLKEYDNIAQAHFNTKNNLSVFFRYYLLIMALPLPLFAVILGNMPGQTTKIQSYEMILNTFIEYIPIFSIILAIVGFCVMLYISGIHFDALLYARQVNGIRWYFDKISPLNNEEKLKVKVLPTDNKKPRINTCHSFDYVIYVFGIIDGAYLWYGIEYYLNLNRWSIVILLIAGVIHYCAYRLMAYRFEEKW